MLAIEESRKLSLANLPSLTLFTGSDQGQYDVMKTQVLKQIGYDPADLNFAYFDMKEVDYNSLELELVSLPFFADEKIVILISHRLASVENCKCNYVFSQGRLIGWGNHKELMRNNPEYIELVNTQKEIENYGGQANAKTE